MTINSFNQAEPTQIVINQISQSEYDLYESYKRSMNEYTSEFNDLLSTASTFVSVFIDQGYESTKPQLKIFQKGDSLVMIFDLQQKKLKEEIYFYYLPKFQSPVLQFTVNGPQQFQFDPETQLFLQNNVPNEQIQLQQNIQDLQMVIMGSDGLFDNVSNGMLTWIVNYFLMEILYNEDLLLKAKSTRSQISIVKKVIWPKITKVFDKFLEMNKKMDIKKKNNIRQQKKLFQITNYSVMKNKMTDVSEKKNEYFKTNINFSLDSQSIENGRDQLESEILLNNFKLMSQQKFTEKIEANQITQQFLEVFVQNSQGVENILKDYRVYINIQEESQRTENEKERIERVLNNEQVELIHPLVQKSIKSQFFFEKKQINKLTEIFNGKLLAYLIARSADYLSKKQNYFSPYYYENKQDENSKGGKEDDITVVVNLIKKEVSEEKNIRKLIQKVQIQKQQTKKQKEIKLKEFLEEAIPFFKKAMSNQKQKNSKIKII